MMKIKVAGLVFALCALPAFADDITVEKYPDADVVLVDERVDTVYQADGTYVTTEEDWKKALTERGRRSLSTLSIGYSLRYGKGEILLVEIIDAEGKVRAVDFASTLKEATDNSSTGANIYDPLDKVLSCSIPGIKIGETLHVKTRRTVTKSRVKDQWADMEIFESTMPIVRTSVRIDGPISRPLKNIAVRNPLGNVVSSVVTNGDRIVYSWTVKNSPQMFPEPAMPPYWTQGQNLRVSTAANWQELSKWYWDVSVPHLEKTNAAMTNKVEEIMASAGANATAIEKVRAMYKFVSQEIRYMGLTMEDTSPGYAPHDVDLTFDNRYGVCRDKAALLVAMFRIAGFESYPVLISVSAAKMDNEVPTPFFNHAVVAVKMDGDYILMDPTDESSRDLCPAYLGDCSYLVAHPEGESLRTAPVVPPAKNALAVVGSGRLGKDGSLLADYAISFHGINDNTYRRRFLSLKPEQRRELFEKVVEGVSAGAELMRCDIEPKDLQDTTKELGVKLLVKYPEVLLRGETRDELSVPSLSSALGSANWLLSGRTALESRKYPLKVSSTALAEEKMEIDLAGAVGATATMPDDNKIEGGYEFTRTFRRDGDKLVFVRRLSVGTIEFSPDEYLNLRESIKRVEASERKNPTFAKDRFANANERIISSVRTYDFFGDSSWVSTNTVVKEILTYKGKKNAAELKFSYNPTWKSVELVSASVSNKNGQVVFAGPKETSVLDADWVASAPRYPASKQLVVNLPSVEIGSVISYTVVTTVKDAPLPFYANFYFDTFTPTDFLSVRVGDWTREVKNPRLLPDEKMLPPGVLWRDVVTISSNSFASAAAKYRTLDPDPVDPKDYDIPTGIVEIRDWMTRHIRRVGPSFGEIRLEDHVVAPETVLKERYATRIGYIRTLCALLKGAGYDADIVFAGDTADSSVAVLMRDMYDFPNVARFSSALCRVKVKKGGFLWWGGETTTYYLGTENEYTPLGATGFNDSAFLDPQTGGFATATALLFDFESDTLEFSIRENGAVDLDFSLKQYGAAVGSARKRYAEMLPEIRSRHFQQMLGKIAQSASATRELVTDTEGYPFSLSFSAFIPDMAVVSGDAISFEVPQLAAHPFGVSGTTRELPIGVGGEETLETSHYKVVFPKGYTEVESLPASLEICNPAKPGEVWIGTVVTSEVKDDVLSVDIVVTHNIHREAMLPAEYLAMLKEWNRLAGSRANSTIVVRRPGI
ncbi:MAG: DUF3857 domain-containing protein [Kiritimatiellae bacterium]|nr:DUF3857 domain-containing protein [Kiritimatiellia bacterium]